LREADREVIELVLEVTGVTVDQVARHREADRAHDAEQLDLRAGGPWS